MISTQEGKARRIKTNLVAGNITTLKLNSMSEMNRVDLSDGIYNIVVNKPERYNNHVTIK